MHDEPKSLLKEAILKALPALHPLPSQYVTPYQTWRKEGEGRWQGEYQLRPDSGKIFAEAGPLIKDLGAAFGESLASHHPDHVGMIGFRGSQMNLERRPTYYVYAALHQLWWRHESFELPDAAIDEIVQEFADFVDFPTVKFRYQVQLLNFRTPADEIALPSGLVMRRLSEREVSSFHGGPVALRGFLRPQTAGMHEFVIEGEIDEPKILGPNHPPGVSITERAKAVLDKAILCLRTFKEGRVGYDYVHFRPVKLCPLPMGSHGSGDLFVPFGNYHLSNEELQDFARHAELIFDVIEDSMKMACSRLADAETRTRPHDRAVDAVIGLESLLLAGLSKEDRRGELSYRFSMRYASLFSSPDERYRAYRIARDLYNLRSMIAHGSSIDGMHRVGDEKIKLVAAARRATETLRYVVRHFLPHVKTAPYKKPEFWDRAVFGLSEPR